MRGPLPLRAADSANLATEKHLVFEIERSVFQRFPIHQL